MVYTIYIDDDFHGVINYNRMREGRTKRPIAFYSAFCRTSCNSRRRIPSFFFRFAIYHRFHATKNCLAFRFFPFICCCTCFPLRCGCLFGGDGANAYISIVIICRRGISESKQRENKEKTKSNGTKGKESKLQAIRSKMMTYCTAMCSHSGEWGWNCRKSLARNGRSHTRWSKDIKHNNFSFRMKCEHCEHRPHQRTVICDDGFSFNVFTVCFLFRFLLFHCFFFFAQFRNLSREGGRESEGWARNRFGWMCQCANRCV